MENKNAKSRLLLSSPELLPRYFHVFLQLPDCILQGCSCIIDLIDDKYVFTDQVGHFEGGKVKPLSPSDFSTRLLHRPIFTKVLVEREPNSLYRDICRSWAFDERTSKPLRGESCDWGLRQLPQDSCRNVATPADGNHEVGLKVIEYAVCGCLTELVNLSGLSDALWGSGAVTALGLAVYLVIRDVHFLHHLIGMS